MISILNYSHFTKRELYLQEYRHSDPAMYHKKRGENDISIKYSLEAKKKSERHFIFIKRLAVSAINGS
jgi:hypothetical protein